MCPHALLNYRSRQYSRGRAGVQSPTRSGQAPGPETTSAGGVPYTAALRDISRGPCIGHRRDALLTCEFMVCLCGSLWTKDGDHDRAGRRFYTKFSRERVQRRGTAEADLEEGGRAVLPRPPHHFRFIFSRGSFAPSCIPNVAGKEIAAAVATLLFFPRLHC